MYRRLQSTRPYTSRLSITACPSLRPRIGQLWSYLHNDKSKRCKVVVSKSGCIYHNLALEDWLYEHTGADIEQRTLLMWRSDPCVVIGKFQNQWQECNYHALRKHSVKVGESFSVPSILKMLSNRQQLSVFKIRKMSCFLSS